MKRINYSSGTPLEAEQAKYIFTKLIALLEEAGAGKEDVFKIKGYLTDM